MSDLPYVIPPAGVSAASFFVPGVYDAARPPATLADDIDPQTGDIRSLFATVSPVIAAVQYAFQLERGSGAAVQGKGQAFKKIKKVRPSTELELRAEIDRIFQPFLDAGLVEILNVTITAPTVGDRSMASGVVDFLEIPTGTSSQVTL